MAQTAAQRAVEVFVSAVQARGGKAEVTTKGSITLVTVTAGERTETLRVKATTTQTWHARRTETAVKAPVTAWALVNLADDAPIALVQADDYAAHVSTVAAAWEAANPGKTITANTTLPVTAEEAAPWADAWSVIGLGEPAAKKAPPAAPKKTAPKKTASATTAPAKTAPAETAPAAKASAAAPVKASAAKIAPLAEQKPVAKKSKKDEALSGIGILLKRIPVVGRLL